MARGKPIIVCSISKSKTSNAVVHIIQQLCPEEDVTFQLAQKGNRFDCRKVVFCHSSLDGRLALTDVNDSVYDKAITEACKIVGKANVTFIVTKVSAADANLRRRMITETQPTLISNIGMLLLVDKFDVVDHVDQDNVNKLRYFLKEADRRVYPPIHPPIHPPIRFLNIFLQLIVISLLMLCLTRVCIQTNKTEPVQLHVWEEVRKEWLELINGLNFTRFVNNVQIQNKTLYKNQSIVERLNEYHVQCVNTTIELVNDMMNRARKILKIERQLKHNEEQINMKSQQNDSIKPSSTDQQIISVEKEIDKINSTVIDQLRNISDVANTLLSDYLNMNRNETSETNENPPQELSWWQKPLSWLGIFGF